jgi:group I intron endonuclease
MNILPEPGIYIIYCISNQKAYVGQSFSLKKRLSDHRRSLRKEEHRNHHLQSAFSKYGENMFTFKALEYVQDATVESLTEREAFWMESFDSIKSGFNMKGAGFTGLHTEETKKRISEMQIGKKLSPEHIEKVRQIHLGRKNSPEHIEALRQSRLGTKHTDEAKAKMSEACKGRVISEEQRIKQSEALKGKKRIFTEEHLKNITEANRRIAAERKAKRLAQTREDCHEI